MSASRLLLALTSLLVLSGCSAPSVMPQLRQTTGERKMEVKSKVALVGSLDYAPNGKSLVSGGAGTTLRVWDLEQAKGTRILPITGTWGTADVAYSPNGKVMAVSGQTKLLGGHVTQLWDVATGKALTAIGSDFGRGLSFSQDSQYLLGSDLQISLWGTDSSINTVKMAEVATGAIIRSFKGYNFGATAPDGRHAVLAHLQIEGKEESIGLVELKTGREVWRQPLGRRNVDAVVFTPDQKYVLASRHEFLNLFGTQAMISIVLLDATTGSQVRELVKYSAETTLMGKGQNILTCLVVSPDGSLVLSGNNYGEYKLWNLASGALVRQLKRPDEKWMFDISPAHAAFSPNGKLLALASAASVRMFDVASGEEVAALMSFDDGEWLITTPSGYYNSSEKGDEYLTVSVAGAPFTIAQLRESFFRPDLVKVALVGGTLGDYKKIADIKPPPAVAIIDTPTTTASSRITLSLRIQEQGGGIGDVRLYRNGAAVVFEKTRNVAVVDASQGSQVLRYELSLEPGRNAIRAIAFNADNSMQSTDALLEVQATIAAHQPALHAVVIGIKDFANPRLALTYPVADAELFADTLEARGKGLFSSIHIQRLVKPEETTNVAIMAALRRARQEVGPEDLFVFYVASHGTVDDGQYFLITSNVGSTATARLRQDALTQDALKELISNIPASKKLVVLDTCSAGQLGDAIQVAMLSRGMSDDTAMKMLSRAVGSTVLSAASSVQEALEGYQGHGLFTYVIVEGLNGAADADKDGFVKTLELADYVDNQVPELADRIFKRKQYPIVSPTGQGFPLAKVK